jgi:hypothetical protein
MKDCAKSPMYQFSRFLKWMILDPQVEGLYHKLGWMCSSYMEIVKRAIEFFKN